MYEKKDTQALEVVASAADLIEWLTVEIEFFADNGDLDAIQSRNADIWRVASAINDATNGHAPWDGVEKMIVAIRGMYGRP